MSLWEYDLAISDYDTDGDVNVPPWIEQNITPADVAAILQGGCASGAYMPAVTYHAVAVELWASSVEDALERLTAEYDERQDAEAES